MDERTFFHQLGKCVYKIDGAYDEYGRNFKIASSNLLWILYALNDGERHSQKQLCEDWAIPRSTANTIIKDLESKNFVTLSPIEGERRELLILLTPSGKEYADKTLSDLYQREKEIFSELKDPEELLALLEEFTKKTQKIAAKKKNKE